MVGLYWFNLEHKKTVCPVEHVSSIWVNIVYGKLLVI